jgi:hypothetical protein
MLSLFGIPVCKLLLKKSHSYPIAGLLLLCSPFWAQGQLEAFSDSLIYEKAFALEKRHPDSAFMFLNLAAERYQKICQNGNGTLRSCEKYITCRNKIGAVYLQAQPKKTEQEYYHYLKMTLEIAERILPENHSVLALTNYRLGAYYDQVRNYSRSLYYSQKAYAIWE